MTTYPPIGCGTRCAADSSSSSGSEVCHQVKCEPKCAKQHCNITECPDLGAPVIGCKFGNAVVEVTAEWILLGAGVTGAGVTGAVSTPTGTTPLLYNNRVDLTVSGNGFFVKGHYIVCPAHLVLLPPQLNSVAVRYPFQDANRAQGLPIQNKMTRCSRILVGVANVNNKGHGFQYEAQLVGVDGAGDIAVLKIYEKTAWNLNNPCIQKCHPWLELGQSRAAVDGQRVYTIQNGIDLSVTPSSLSDHRYLDQTGLALPEMILVAQPLYEIGSGAPVVNGQGQVLGFLTAGAAAAGPTGFYQMGPSEFFFSRVVKTIIKNSCSRKCCAQVLTICDPAGAYLSYQKAYLGVAYQLFDGADYDITTDYTSATGANGVENGNPRVRLTSAGAFMYQPSCKQIIGIQVLGVAGGNTGDAFGVTNGYWFVPGGTAAASSYLASPLPVSGFLGTVNPGDMITHINGVALGDLEKQVAPALVTWRVRPGDQVEITFRQGGNAINTADNSLTSNYDNLISFSTCVGMMPPVVDYPAYATNQTAFAYLQTAAASYPGFSNPNGIALSLGPSLINGAPYRPSI